MGSLEEELASLYIDKKCRNASTVGDKIRKAMKNVLNSLNSSFFSLFISRIQKLQENLSIFVVSSKIIY
jgi:hypothetical protein